MTGIVNNLRLMPSMQPKYTPKQSLKEHCFCPPSNNSRSFGEETLNAHFVTYFTQHTNNHTQEDWGIPGDENKKFCTGNEAG